MHDQELINKFARQHNLDLIILFGSRAKGTAVAESDTDIAVRADRSLTLKERIDLAIELDQFYSASEVVDIRSASPLLLAAIARHGVLLYQAKPDLFAKFKLYAYNVYFDFKPVLDRLSSATRAQIEALKNESN